jgi:hypothetical protein
MLDHDPKQSMKNRKVVNLGAKVWRHDLPRGYVLLSYTQGRGSRMPDAWDLWIGPQRDLNE